MRSYHIYVHTNPTCTIDPDYVFRDHYFVSAG